MDLKKSWGQKNKVIVVQKEKRPGCFLSFWITMTRFFAPYFFQVHILNLIFLGSQTDPCIQNKNSGCRLTWRMSTDKRQNIAIKTSLTLGTSTYAPAVKKMAKCLISYYGITNETCWYPSKIESAEADVQDTLGNKIVNQRSKLVFAVFLQVFATPKN